MKPPRLRTAVVVLILLTLVTRLPLFWTTFLNVDETLFALFVKVWQYGGIPYVDAFETKAIGVHLFYWLASWLSRSLPDVSMLAVHLLSLAWTLATAGVLWRMTERLTSRTAGFLAALFFVTFSANYIPHIIATGMEVVLLLPVCFAIDALLRPPSSLKLSHSFWAGLCVSAAMITKYQAGIMVPVILLYYLLLLRMEPTWRWRSALRHAFAFAAGHIPLTAWMLLYLYSKGGLPGFIFWTVQGNLFYINSGSTGIPLSVILLQYIIPYLASTALVWVLTGEQFLAWWRHRHEPVSEKRAQETLLWLWFFLTIIPVSLGNRFYGHYFLLLMPTLSIFSGTALAGWSAERWKRWRGAVLIAFILPTVGFAAVRVLLPTIEKMTGRAADDLESLRPYADTLKKRTRPEDRILVWGSTPAIYWYADRFPSTQFFTIGFLSGHVPGKADDDPYDQPQESLMLPGAWKMFLSDTERHPPVYILDITTTGLYGYNKCAIQHYPQWAAYVQEHYQEEPSFRGARIYRRR